MALHLTGSIQTTGSLGVTGSVEFTTNVQHPQSGTWSTADFLSQNTENLAGAGTKDAGLAFGGYSNFNPISNTEEYNGTSWLAGGNLNEAATKLGGTGTQTSALAMAGYGSNGNLNRVEEYNGATWTYGISMPFVTRDFQASGTQTAALASSLFIDTTNTCCTLEFNGASWSSGGNMSDTAYGRAAAGTLNAALAIGGYGLYGANCTEEYDGVLWSTVGTLSTARQYLSAVGKQTSALAFGGYDSINTFSVVECTEEYDGTSWSSVGGLNSPRQCLAGAGSVRAGLAFGGNNGTPVSLSEEYLPIFSSSLDKNFRNSSTTGDISATGSFRGSFTGDGSQLTGIDHNFNPSLNTIPYRESTGGYEDSPLVVSGSASGGTLSGGSLWDMQSSGYGTGNLVGLINLGQSVNAEVGLDLSQFPAFPSNPPALNSEVVMNVTVQINKPSITGFSGIYIPVGVYYGTVTTQAGSGPFSPNQIGVTFSNTSTWSDPNGFSSFNIGTTILPGSSGSIGFGSSYTPSLTTKVNGNIEASGSVEFQSSTATIGSTWSSAPNLTQGGMISKGGAGSTTAALAFAGYDTSTFTPESSCTEEFNGESWSAGGSLNHNRLYVAGAGTQTAALAVGGYSPLSGPITCVEQYDGISWGQRAPITTNSSNQFGCAIGTSTSALHFSGVGTSATNEYNGTSWTSGGNMNTQRNELAGAGSVSAGLAFGGYDSISTFNVVSCTEEYDGISWGSNNPMSTARSGVAGAGTQHSALAFGGNDVGGSTTTCVEEYNGTSWTTKSSLTNGADYNASAGSSQSALSSGGKNNGMYQSTVEEFTNDSTGGNQTTLKFTRSTGKTMIIPPTTDPLIAGALWNNNGNLVISAG